METEGWVGELRKVSKLAAPIMICNVLSNLLNLEDQIFVGHLGTTELAAAAIGNTYFCMLWFFLCGCASACDTLVAQAYGKGDEKAINFWTNQGYLALTLLNIPACVGLAFAPFIIRHVFRESEEISQLAGLYCQIQIPSLFFLCAFSVLEKVQQAQNNLRPSVYVSVFANIVNIIGNYVFIWGFNLGFVGSPLATSVSRVFSFFLLLYLSARFPPQIPVPLLTQREVVTEMTKYGSLDTFHELLPSQPNIWLGLKEFFTLGLPGGFMLMFESWSFLIITMESGILGTVPCAASQVLMMYTSVIYMAVGMSLGQAATIRVGNLLGAQRPFEARQVSVLCVGLASVSMTVLGLSTVVCRRQIGALFSNDPEVIAMVGLISPLAALFQFFDGFQTACIFVLRAMGKQSSAAVIYGVGFWVFGVPLGALLCFWLSLGIFGLWYGLILGLIMVSLGCAVALCAVNWEQEALKALENTKIPVDPVFSHSAVTPL